MQKTADNVWKLIFAKGFKKTGRVESVTVSVPLSVRYRLKDDPRTFGPAAIGYPSKGDEVIGVPDVSKVAGTMIWFASDPTQKWSVPNSILERLD